MTVKNLKVKQSSRLDSFLSEELAVTRSRVQRLIKQELVTVNNKVVTKAGCRLSQGDSVNCKMEEKLDEQLTPYDLDLEILYEDEYLIVINKPAGLTMHPGVGTGNKTLANAIASKLSTGFNKESSKFRPGIVHRLDKDTTGVVVVARTPDVHADLSKQFAERSVERRYLALVLSTPRGSRLIRQHDSGIIDAPLGRHPKRRTEIAIVEKGRAARTNWRVIERMAYGALVSLKLETGRTHQIRVHMTSILSPVIGDKTYGDFSVLPKKLSEAVDKFGRQALHAEYLAFNHPYKKERLEFSTSPPSDMLGLVELFRGVKA